MDCVEEQHVKQLIADSLNIEATVERVPVKYQRGLYAFELTITLSMDDKVLSKSTITIPGVTDEN